MNLLQGIQLHELIMMILGFILGLTLIFIFLYTALKSTPNLKLLYGFIAPVIMIGYPSFKANQFGNQIVKIEDLVEKVNQNPTDTTAQNTLVSALTTLPASRCTTSVDAMTAIANAQATLGLYDSANVMIKRAVSFDNNSQKAKQSQKEILEKKKVHDNIKQHVNKIDQQLKVIEQKPGDRLLRDTLASQLQVLQKMTDINVVRLENQQVLTIAKAVYVAGQKETANQITEEVLKAKPDEQKAINLKKDMQNKVIDKKYPPIKPRVSDKTKLPKPAPAPANDAKASRVETVPAPAPVYQDTALRIRVLPKAVESLRKWDPKG